MTTKSTKRSSNRLIYILLAALVLAMVLAAIFSRDAKGEEVTLAEVERRDVTERILASGRVFAETVVKISSDVSGEIVELYVKEGDSVKMGQRLVRIDPEAFISSVERGQATLNNAKAQLAASKASVKNAEAQVIQIQAQLENAKLIYERNKKLLQDGVISDQEYERTLAEYNALRANYQMAEAGVESNTESMNAAEFTVASQNAALKELKTQLNRTSIHAPTNGVVSALFVELGERVVGTTQMQGTDIMQIANFSSMEVRVEVNEHDIIEVSLGDLAEIELSAYSDRLFTGVVTEIASSSTSANAVTNNLNSDQVTNFIVKVRIDESSYRDLIQPNQLFPLRPGMSASVEILTESVKDVLVVPIECVTARDRKTKKTKKADTDLDDLQEVVFVVKNDTVDLMEVVTGIQDDTYIQLIEGPSPGEQVVKGPYNTVAKKLDEGDQIHVKDDDEDE